MERLAHTANHTRQQGGQRLSPGLAWPLTQLLAEGLLLPCPPLDLSAWSIVATGAQGCREGVLSGLASLPALTRHTLKRTGDKVSTQKT